jgi:hypothetical protein
MQEANWAMVLPPPASLSDVPPPLEEEVAGPAFPPEPAGVAPVVVLPALVVVPIFATPGEPDFPPQPAKRTAARTNPRAAAASRFGFRGGIAVQGYRRPGYDSGTGVVIRL